MLPLYNPGRGRQQAGESGCCGIIWSLVSREKRHQDMHLRLEKVYLGGVAVLTLDPTLAVELEAISALIKPMEFGWWWVTGHGNTSNLLPAAILGALSLEGPSSKKIGEKRQLRTKTSEPHHRNILSSGLTVVFLFLIPFPVSSGWGGMCSD